MCIYTHSTLVATFDFFFLLCQTLTLGYTGTSIAESTNSTLKKSMSPSMTLQVGCRRLDALHVHAPVFSPFSQSVYVLPTLSFSQSSLLQDVIVKTLHNEIRREDMEATYRAQHAINYTAASAPALPPDATADSHVPLQTVVAHMKHQFGIRALKLFEEQANEVAHYTVTVGSTDHTFLVQSNRPPRDPAAPPRPPPPPRTVIVQDNAERSRWSCNCCEPPSTGVPCRHILACMLKAERLTVADCAALFHPRWKRNMVFPEHTMKKVCSQATRDRLLARAGPPQGHLESEALSTLGEHAFILHCCACCIRGCCSRSGASPTRC